jgi:hypothetical protein
MMMIMAFALAGAIGSTWYWWCRVKHLEAVLTDIGQIMGGKAQELINEIINEGKE